jgi:hypothetical protein
MRLKHTADTATKSMHDDDLGKSLLQLFRSQRSGIVHFEFASIGVVGAVLAVTVTLGLCLLRSRQYLGSYVHQQIVEDSPINTVAILNS